MKVAIIGGKLQGTEAVYLASACGFESILIDKNAKAPASTLADRFVCSDVVSREQAAVEAMCEADFVLPANENDQVLEAVCSICEEKKIPLAFDMEAYNITKSKRKSDQLMHQAGIPAPRYYPWGKPPYVIKPSSESGSTGVRYAKTQGEAEAFLAQCQNRENWIVQEFLEGPSYSIEIIGNPKAGYRTYPITQIHMDPVYDCCKVTAPVLLSEEKHRRFEEIALRLAKLVNLHGIMDVEVIDDGEDLKVLEIDARLPSQTPIAVLHTGSMNYLSEIADIILYDRFCEEQRKAELFSVYEHYGRQHEQIFQAGEHMMAQASPLRMEKNAFGAKVAISDYRPGEDAFRGIYINWADSLDKLEQARKDTLKELKLLP